MLLSPLMENFCVESIIEFKYEKFLFCYLPLILFFAAFFSQRQRWTQRIKVRNHKLRKYYSTFCSLSRRFRNCWRSDEGNSSLFFVSPNLFIRYLQSITLYLYKAEEGVLEEIAKDFNPNWMTAIEVCLSFLFILSFFTLPLRCLMMILILVPKIRLICLL